MAVVVGDFQHGSEYVPYHADLIRLLTARDDALPFELSGITILVQNAKRLYPYGYPGGSSFHAKERDCGPGWTPPGGTSKPRAVVNV